MSGEDLLLHMRKLAVVEIMTPLENQNLQRLKINRIALTQELRVEHVLTPLVSRGVLDKQDCDFVMRGQSQSERVGRLLDLLPTKGKKSNWYKHFRSVLQSPDTMNADVRRHYQILIEFLDSALVMRLRHSSTPQGNGSSPQLSSMQSSYPRLAALPAIRMSHGDEPYQNLDLHSSQGNSEHQSSLAATAEGNPQSNWRNTGFGKYVNRADLERAVFENMHRVESEHSSWKQGLLPRPSDTGLPDCVEQMLLDVDSHHVYVKYLVALRNIRSLDIVCDLAAGFQALCKKISSGSQEVDSKNNVISKLGSSLSSLLQELGNFGEACNVLNSVCSFLELSSSKDASSWKNLFDTHVQAIRLHVCSGDFVAANVAFVKAIELKAKLDRLAFGRIAIDGAHLALSAYVLLRDSGQLTASYDWLRKAMQEVNSDNHSAVVSVLCTTSLAYTARGSFARAEALVVQAVQLSRASFGVMSAQYVEALLHYVIFSNELRQDEQGVAAAEQLVTLGEKVYGPNTATIATLLQAFAGALVAAAIVSSHSDRAVIACKHARRAVSIAMAALRTEAPCVSSLRETLGLSLLRAAVSSPDVAEHQRCIAEAEVELKAALDGHIRWYGNSSLRAAMGCFALGQLSAAKKDWTSGAEFYQRTLDILSACSLPIGSCEQHKVKEAFGTLCSAAGRHPEAVTYLKDVTDTFNTQGYPVKWVAAAYHTLATSQEALGDSDGVRQTKARLVAWLWDAEDHTTARWQDLDGEPRDVKAFLGTFNLWREESKKVRAGLHRLMGAGALKH